MGQDNHSQQREAIQTHSGNKASVLTHPYFIFSLAVPWVLDMLTPSLFLTTLLGASLWYLLMASIVISKRSRDPKLARPFKILSYLLWPAWLAGFVANLSSQSFPLATWTDVPALTWMVRVHATLLAGASGLVFLIAAACIAWLIQRRRVEAPSWNRRNRGLSLPSLESLSYVIQKASVWAFLFWGIGLFIAVLTLMKSKHLDFSEVILSDFQILSSIALWSVLAITWLFSSYKIIHGQKRRQRVILGSTVVFWGLLIFQAFLRYNVDSFHEPIRWWIR